MSVGRRRSTAPAACTVTPTRRRLVTSPIDSSTRIASRATVRDTAYSWSMRPRAQHLPDGEVAVGDEPAELLQQAGVQAGRARPARVTGTVIASFRSQSLDQLKSDEFAKTLAMILVSCRHRRRTQRNRDACVAPPHTTRPHRSSPSWASPAPARRPWAPRWPSGWASRSPTRTTSIRRPTSPRCRRAPRSTTPTGCPGCRRSAQWLADHAATGAVVSCSALKRWYRDILREAAPTQFFVHLDGSPDVVARRVAGRPRTLHAGEPGRLPVRHPGAAGARRGRYRPRPRSPVDDARRPCLRPRSRRTADRPIHSTARKPVMTTLLVLAQAAGRTAGLGLA